MAILDSLYTTEFRENWAILLVAFICMLFAFSAPALLAPFIYPDVIQEFGWTREQATFLASAKYLTGSVIAIVVGRVVDLIGVRRVLIYVSVAGGLALVSFLWTTGLAMYYAAGVLLGIAGAGTMVAVKVLISRTFHASQGTAMGIVMLGTSVGAVVLPLPMTFVIEDYGWRIGSALLSAGVWLIALPLMFFCLNDKLFGESHKATTLANNADGSGTDGLKGLLVQPRFWLICAAVFSAGFVDQALIQHQVLYLRNDLGLSATYVAAGISAIGLIGMIARPTVGALCDKWSLRGVSLAYTGLSASCLLALVAIHPLAFAAFVVFRAVGHAAVLLDTTILTKHTFGERNIGTMLGLLTAVVNLGFAAGTWSVARIYSVAGSYLPAFVVCTAIGIFAAAVLIPVKPVYWVRHIRQPEKPATG